MKMRSNNSITSPAGFDVDLTNHGLYDDAVVGPAPVACSPIPIFASFYSARS